MEKSNKKRKRVKHSSDGSLNKEDILHNNDSYRRSFLKDNPWMLKEIEEGRATYNDFLSAGIIDVDSSNNNI